MSQDVLNKLAAKKVESLIDFAKTFIFKDFYEAQKDEDSNQQTFQNRYLRECLWLAAKDFQVSPEFEIRNSINTFLVNTKQIYDTYNTGSYEPQIYGESNKYYRDLYIQHGVDIFIARTQDHLDIIKYDETVGKLSDQDISQFLSAYAKAKTFFMKTQYTESFGMDKEYFNFARFFIVFNALQIFMNDSMKNVLTIDLLDEYQIENLLYSYGIYFLKGLSTTYKKKLIKNLNFLFNNKGNDQIFTTILGVFGLQNIQAFRYYLIKSYEDIPSKVDNKEDILFNLTDPDIPSALAAIDANPALTDPEKTELKFKTKVNLEGQIRYNKQLREKYKYSHVKDTSVDNSMTLKFIRVPFGEKNLETFISDKGFAKYDFSEVVSGDPTWKLNEEDVAKLQFNHIQTKYFDIRSSFDILKQTTQLQYFYNTFKQIVTNYSKTAQPDFLNFNAGEFSTQPIQLFDSLIGLAIITSAIVGYDMHIIKDAQSIFKIYGFQENSFKLEQLSEPTIRGLGVFTGYSDVNSLLLNQNQSSRFAQNIDTNLQIKDKMEQMMVAESSPADYFKIRQDYFALFLADNNNRVFQEHVTYEDYLKTSNLPFYNQIRQVLDTNDKDKYRQLFDQINTAVTQSMQTSQFNPGIMNGDYLNFFIYKLIDFFKSYTIQLRDLSIFYTFDNEFLNRFKLLDEIFLLLTQPRFQEDVHPILDKIEQFQLSGIQKHSSLIAIDRQLIQTLYRMEDSMTEQGLTGFDPSKFNSQGEYIDSRDIYQLMDRKQINTQVKHQHDSIDIDTHCQLTQINSKFQQLATNDSVKLNITDAGVIMATERLPIQQYISANSNRDIMSYNYLDNPSHLFVINHSKYLDSVAGKLFNTVSTTEICSHQLYHRLSTRQQDPRINISEVPQVNTDDTLTTTNIVDVYRVFPGLQTTRGYTVQRQIEWNNLPVGMSRVFNQINANDFVQKNTVICDAPLNGKYITIRLQEYRVRTQNGTVYGRRAQNFIIKNFNGTMNIKSCTPSETLTAGLISAVIYDSSTNKLVLRSRQDSHIEPMNVMQYVIISPNDKTFMDNFPFTMTAQSNDIITKNDSEIVISSDFKNLSNRRLVAQFDRSRFDGALLQFISESEYHNDLMQGGQMLIMKEKDGSIISQTAFYFGDGSNTKVTLLIDNDLNKPIFHVYMDETSQWGVFQVLPSGKMKTTVNAHSFIF